MNQSPNPVFGVKCRAGASVGYFETIIIMYITIISFRVLRHFPTCWYIGFASIVIPSMLLFRVVYQAFSVAVVDTCVLLSGPVVRIVLSFLRLM